MSLTWLSHSALHSAMDATDIPPLSDVVLAQTVVSISYWRDGAHGGDGGGKGDAACVYEYQFHTALVSQ